MMTILLGILKIIGIVIVLLIAVFLVCLLILLFCPICYSIQGNYTDSKLRAVGRVSFFGRLVRVDFRYNSGEELWYRAKILFYTILSSEPLPARKKKLKKDTVNISDNTDKHIDNNIKSHSKSDVDSSEQIEKKSNKDLDKTSNIENITQEHKKLKQSHYKKRKRKHTSLVAKIKSKIQSITKKIRRVWQRFASVKRKTQLLIKLKNAETTQKAYKSIKKYSKTIFRHIRPRTIKGSFTFGFDDPACTGEVLGVLSLFYPVYKTNVKITPYFDRSYLDANLLLKGHIQIIIFAIVAIKVYTNKYIKKTIERWNHIKGGK